MSSTIIVMIFSAGIPLLLIIWYAWHMSAYRIIFILKTNLNAQISFMTKKQVQFDNNLS